METGYLPRAPLTGGSFKATHPFAKRAGEPIAGPYSFAFCGSKGDLEFHQMSYPTLHSYLTHMNFVCNKCWASAHIAGTYYTDISDNAGWKRTTMSTDEWLRNLSYRSPLTTLTGWHLSLQLWDLLHNLHQGTGKDHVGAGVVLLCTMKWFKGHDMDERFATATECCSTFWKSRGVDLHIRAFTKGSLHYAPLKEYPHYDGKAYMVKMTMIWFPGSASNWKGSGG